MDHRTIVLQICLLDAEKQRKKDCRKLSYDIEKEFSYWIWELQFNYLLKYRAGEILKSDYDKKTKEFTQGLNVLAETSLLKRKAFNDRSS